MSTSVKRVEIPEGHRIAAISDIHGNFDFLRELLKKIHYSETDILFLVGDLIDKGEQSLKTLRYIMELSKTNPVYCTCGNVDRSRVDLLDEKGDGAADHFRNHVLFMKQHWGGGLLCDMMEEAGFVPAPDCRWEVCMEAVKERFQMEIDFLRSLPDIIETEKFIFVHGGLPAQAGETGRQCTSEILKGARERDRYDFLKFDAFMDLGTSFDRFVVVGHWPTVLYSKNIPCMNPILDTERKILSIDGGCGVKSDGQLNALLIDDIRTCRFSFETCDLFSEAAARDAQEGSGEGESVYIPWVDNKVRIVDGNCKTDEYITVEHKSSRRRMRMLSNKIWSLSDNGVDAECVDATDYELEVRAQDALKILERASDGYLAKKDGTIGWYRGRLK